MFDLTIQISQGRTYEGFDCKVISQGESVHGGWIVPEDAEVGIHLVTSEKARSLGEPQLYIGDVLHEFELTSASDGRYHWHVLFDEDESFGIPFRNYVGRSEIILAFKSSDIRVRSLVDIQANKINAELAEGMLTYLNEHYDSIVSICFSRSKLSGDTGKGDENSINRLIEEAQSGIELCESVWPELLNRVRERWETELDLQSNSLPNSPKGIAWLSNNPNGIHYCEQNKQMFKVNGYPVISTKSAREVVIHNRDLIENRVIHGYLAHLELQLVDTKKKLESENTSETGSKQYDFGEYVSLDHILSKYRIPIVLGLVDRLSNLISRVRLLRKRFSTKVNLPRDLKPVPPCVTPFVARTPSYLKVFDKIAKWYEFGKVQLGLGELLFGLRHLSTLYEFTVLTQLISALESSGSDLVESSWRDYEVAEFGGEEKPRPISAINNYFRFSNASRKLSVELFYEPIIWTKHKAQSGDPVDVCREHQGRAWQHRKPDYLLRLWFEGAVEPILLVFDAKFSSAYKVKHEKLPDLVNKYLLGLHQKKVDGGYGNLPIQAVWAIYPKGKAPKVDFYASYHSLGGQDSVLPSLGGLRIRPNEEDYLARMIDKLLDQLQTEFAESGLADGLNVDTFTELKIA
ncbi:hypothetical protein NDJ83_19830 [Vibrio alginolyticus]|uniref:hypothetical protein n=1 Tax=Vibrio alginolyticus TaxID=663 RepID=UPI0021610107|nr:hypothetical protein [Vibrio alginolyticus]MCS0281482.1 hypothetical protein [Vibrio alginolyticus]